MSGLAYWIWLANACGAGSAIPDSLFERYGEDAEAIYALSEEEITALVPKEDIRAALCKKDLEEANEIELYCRRQNIGILALNDPLYPMRLRTIRCKPVLLYYRGALPKIDDQVCIATVGTRRMTEYGKRSGYMISYDLAKGGAIVVSGMASGIDGICHRGCLDGGGHTIAVLGCGIDRAYPAEHRELMQEIILHGTVLTEYKPFTPPVGSNFPIRNRIISGLCQGTLIVEADLRSGAMITAKDALVQGRDVFALPGKVGEQNSFGTNQLIQDGAKMVTNAVDILEEYEYLYPHRISIAAIPKFRPKHTISPLAKAKAPEPQTAVQYEQNKQTLPRATDEPFVPAASAQTVLIPGDTSSRSVTEQSAPQTRSISKKKDKHTKKQNEQVLVAQKGETLPPPCDPALYDRLSEKERAVYDALGNGANADTLAAVLQEPISTIMSVLTNLEVKGAIKGLPGGLFIRRS